MPDNSAVRRPSIDNILNPKPVGFDMQRFLERMRSLRSPVVVTKQTEQFYDFWVTYNGFYCRHETYDDMFNADGAYDEVWCEADLKVLSPTGAAKQETNRHTLRVYGTTFTFTAPLTFKYNPQRESWGRVMVVGQGGNNPFEGIPNGYGSGNGRFGGIRSGDGVPNRERPWMNLDIYGNTALHPDQLPMLLFRTSGRMSEVSDDVLMLTPHIYEYDGGQGFAGFAKQTSDAIAKHIPDVAKVAGLTTGNPIIWGVLTASQISRALVDLFTAIFGTPGDRPIGLVDEGGTKKYDPSSLLVGLTPDSMRAAAATDWGFGPGIWPFTRREAGSQLDGDYDGWLQLHFREFAQP